MFIREAPRSFVHPHSAWMIAIYIGIHKVSILDIVVCSFSSTLYSVYTFISSTCETSIIPLPRFFEVSKLPTFPKKTQYYSNTILLFSRSATAFMCHHNTFLVYKSMQDATLERWEKVTHFSIAFACIVSAIFGMAGYATFRGLSQGKIQSTNSSVIKYAFRV